MADKTVAEITQPVAYDVDPGIEEQIQQDDAQLEKDKSISLTSSGAQVNTWFSNAADNSVASELGEWFGTPNFRSEKDYYMDDEVAMHTLQVNKLPMTNFGEIRNTKSTEELNFRILRAQRDAKFRERVDSQLTYDGAFSMQNTSALAGQLLDDVAIGVLSGGIGAGASMLTGSTRSLSMAMLADVSLESGLAAGRYATNDDYSMNDVYTDLTLGLMPSAIMAYRSSKIFTKMRDSSVDMNKQATKSADEAMATPKNKETPSTKPKEKPAPQSVATNRLNTDSAKRVVSHLKKTGLKGTRNITDITEEISKTVRKYNKAKKPETRKRLSDTIAKLEQTPEARLVLQSAEIINDPTFIKQLGDDIKDLHAQVDTKTSKAIVKSIKSQISKEDFDTLSKIIKGQPVTKEAMSKATKGKIATALVAAMVVPQAAEASGDEDISEAIYTAAIAIALGAAGVQFIKASGGTKQALQRLTSNWDKKSLDAKYAVSEEARAIRKASVKISNAIDTELTNTKVLFTGNPEAMNLIDEMVGKGSTLDMGIRQMYESALGDINRSMRNHFEAWKKNNNHKSGTLDSFNKLASDYIDNADNIPNPDKHISAMVNDYHKIMEKLYAEATASGAKGFEKFKYNKNTMPRLWKTTQIKELFQGITKGSNDYDAVVGNLQNAFKRSISDYRLRMAEEGKVVFKGKSDEVVAKQYTDKFVALWTSNKFSRFSKDNANRDVKKIQKFLIDNKIVNKEDTDLLDDLAASVVPQSQVSARAKRRVVLNPNYIEQLSIKHNGKPMTIDKSTFIERDLMQIADMTSKELSITSTYANKGYLTRSMLETKINDVAKTDKEYNTLMEYKALLEGMPTLTNSPLVESFISLSRVATSVAKLPLVAFSTVPEFMNVLSRGGMVKGAQGISKAMLKRYPPNGEVMQLRQITGLASFNDRLYRKGYIGYDEMNDKLNPNKGIMQFAKGLEDWAYTVNRLGWLTDVTQLAGIEANLRQLRTFASTGKGLPISRLDEYGVTSKWMDEFKDDLMKPELDMNNWSVSKQNRFGEVIRSLNQTISPETMLHTKGVWTSTTSFGRMVSPLLHYSATVMNEQGLPLLRHTDRHSALNNINAVVGAYIGLNLKYALEGKEIEQEDILLYAITGSPLMGGFGVARGILNPATLDVSKDMFNIVAPEAIEAR